MPTLGAGFGHSRFGIDAFGDTADTAGFTAAIEALHIEPTLMFVYDGRPYLDSVITVPTLSSGVDVIAGTTNIVLSNTPRSQIHATTIAFSENTPNPDTITDSGNGFVTAGFLPNDTITLTGSTSNDGTYKIAAVSAGVITLVTNDDLTTESAGDLVTILSQATFNFFANDRINTIGKPCGVGMFFSGVTGYLYFLSGTVEEVSYDGATITLSCRDAMAPMLERRIGSGQSPANYYSATGTWGSIKIPGRNPAQLAWELITQWGELDDTKSTDNININFTSWDAWFTRCAAHNYIVRGRFPGTTIRHALLRIAEMTNSFIWVDGQGFFNFSMFEPPVTADASDALFDTDNSLAIGLDIDKSTVKNVITVYYGYDPDQRSTNKAEITSDKLGFANNNPDRIYIANTDHFLPAGFDTSDPITVSGSERNDGVYFLQTVADGVLTLVNSNGLTDEDSGATVTLTQSQDTTTLSSTSVVFVDGGGSNDTIEDTAGVFISAGLTANDSITVVGSTSNDGTYVVATITADTITLDAAETLTTEPSGDIITLTQTHSVSVTATTIAFNDDEIGTGRRITLPGGGFDFSDVDHINKADGGLLTAGFLPQYQVTVTGSISNDGTYRLQDVTGVQLSLQHQTLADENSGATVTITQSHTTQTTGKQFEYFVTAANFSSIDIFGRLVLVDEDKVVWHDNLQSAAEAADQKLLILKWPSKLTRITSLMEGPLSTVMLYSFF